MRTFSVLLAAVACAGIFSASTAQAQHVTKISAADLVTNGESFFAAGNITSELTRLARADGYIGSTESFKSISVSGVPIATVLSQYKNCTPKPIYLISDGGGIDLMGSCPSPVTENCSIIQSCKTTLQSYLAEMKKDGTKKVLWMIYPDPQGSQWATLKANQDVWAIVAPQVIAACTDPKPLLVDLRPVWAGHYSQYTSDGIHCTDAGGTATAEAFWKAMKDSSFFDLTVPVQTSRIAKTAPSIFLGQEVSHHTLTVSMSIVQPSTITARITTVSGRTVLNSMKHLPGNGLQSARFQLGAIAPGMYCLEVQTGRFTNQSALLVP